MTKHIEFNLTQNLSEIANTAIRKKSDIILLILNAIGIILSDVKVEDNNLGTFSLYINKMSRIFFSTKYDNNGRYLKHFSFSFPFTINIEDGVITELYSTTSKLKINTSVIRVLLNLAGDNLFNEKDASHSLYDELDSFIEAMEIHYSTNGREEIEDVVWTTAKELLLFEPGYIRYDYDPGERVDPIMHPLHHVDIFYSSQVTFKLGIIETLIQNVMLERNELISLLDITTPCHYLNLGK